MELQHGYRMQEMGAQNDFTSKRDATLNQFQTERDTRQNDFQTQRDERQHGYRIGEIGAQGASTQANTRLSNDLQAQREERSRTWERERLGITDGQQTDRDRRLHDYKLEEADRAADAKARARMSTYGNTSGLNPDDRRQFAALDKLYGDDPEAMRQALVASGNPRLEALAKSGGQGGGEAGRKKAEMSADDKRLYDAVVERHTDQMLKKTDWEAVSRDLRGLQRDDLASFAVNHPDPSAWQRVDIPKDLQPPRPGAGSQTAPAGRSTPPPTEQPAQPQAAQLQPVQRSADQPPASSAPNPPAGKGTQAEPFQATSQADIEWFKASAPKGAVIVINGKPFTK